MLILNEVLNQILQAAIANKREGERSKQDGALKENLMKEERLGIELWLVFGSAEEKGTMS